MNRLIEISKHNYKPINKSFSSPSLSLEASEHVFEGAEKRLEVDFVPSSDFPLGMRAISREQWDTLLKLVNCLIIGTTSNEHFDSYVLSESSLFVYPFKVMIKTCGTTTLLECVSKLLEYAEDLGLEVDYVTYSRKTFKFPQRQMDPHRDFNDEVYTLNQWFSGEGYVLGPVNGERWFVYVADVSQQAGQKETEQAIEILMNDLDPHSMRQFFKVGNQLNAKQITTTSGISEIIPNSIIDEHLFDPCGYSMNGLKDAYYSTIHVTPESGFSYVSYETNLPLRSYTALIKSVINVFRPDKMIVSVYASNKALCGSSSSSFDPKFHDYTLNCKVTSEFENRRNVTCYHYRRNAIA